MVSRVEQAGANTLLWSTGVIELRRGSRWVVAPAGHAVWNAGRTAIFASHGSADVFELALSPAAASRLPDDQVVYQISDLLRVLLPQITRYPHGHYRRMLDEQLVVDELAHGRLRERGLYLDRAIPGLGWGTTLGVVSHAQAIATNDAAERALAACAAAAVGADAFLRLRLGLILKAYELSIPRISDELGFQSGEHFSRLLEELAD